MTKQGILSNVSLVTCVHKLHSANLYEYKLSYKGVKINNKDVPKADPSGTWNVKFMKSLKDDATLVAFFSLLFR